jgi:hypothetical protein
MPTYVSYVHTVIVKMELLQDFEYLRIESDKRTKNDDLHGDDGEHNKDDLHFFLSAMNSKRNLKVFLKTDCNCLYLIFESESSIFFINLLGRMFI